MTQVFSKPLHSLLSSILCQGIGFACSVLSWQVTSSYTLSGIVYVITALCLALFLRLSVVWIFFNALVPLTLWFLQPAETASWVPLFLFFILLVLFLPTLLSGVPYYPSSNHAYRIIARHLPAEHPFRLVDLGCGFGGLLLYLARQFPQGTFVGVEISPLAFLISWIRVKTSKMPNVQIVYRNIWNVNLAAFDVVYAFLSPLVMEQLWKKAKNELQPGSLFISNTFETPRDADEVYQLTDDKKCKLLLYKID